MLYRMQITILNCNVKLSEIGGSIYLHQTKLISCYLKPSHFWNPSVVEVFADKWSSFFYFFFVS